jgi:hypothetical protein
MFFKPSRKINFDTKRGFIMSMRGELISKEYQSMVFVRDDNGGEYVCYAKDLKNAEHVSESEKEHCLDTSLVMGPNW